VSNKAGVAGQAVALSDSFRWGGKSEHHRARRLRSTEGPAGDILQERTVSQRTDIFHRKVEEKGETVV